MKNDLDRHGFTPHVKSKEPQTLREALSQNSTQSVFNGFTEFSDFDRQLLATAREQIKEVRSDLKREDLAPLEKELAEKELGDLQLMEAEILASIREYDSFSDQLVKMTENMQSFFPEGTKLYVK